MAVEVYKTVFELRRDLRVFSQMELLDDSIPRDYVHHLLDTLNDNRMSLEILDGSLKIVNDDSLPESLEALAFPILPQHRIMVLRQLALSRHAAD